MGRLKPSEKGMNQIHTLGGAQQLSTVSESGLYRLVFRSDKPDAADRIDSEDRRKTPVLGRDAVSRLLPEESTTIAFNDSGFPTVTGLQPA